MIYLLEPKIGGYRVGDIYIPPPIKPYCSSESQGSRLIITQIMNTNFKSYAGDVPLGPFCHVSTQFASDQVSVCLYVIRLIELFLV